MKPELIAVRQIITYNRALRLSISPTFLLYKLPHGQPTEAHRHPSLLHPVLLHT